MVFESPNIYIFCCKFQGSDPRAATCRGKLQNRRCKLNQEINKELRLRAGAENLFKVSTILGIKIKKKIHVLGVPTRFVSFL